MKYGLSLGFWTSVFTKDELRLIPRVKKLGFDGVEFSSDLTELKDRDIEAVRTALKGNDLGCVLCPPGSERRNLTSQDSSVRREAIGHFTCHIRIANKLGSKILGGDLYGCLGAGKPRNPKTREEWDLAVKGIKELSKVAEDYGVILALEPINRYETNLLNTAEDTVKLIEEVGTPNVGVHLDTFHMCIEEKDFYGVIKNTGKHLVYVHVCENDRGIIGTGLVDWKGVSKALKEIGYDRWITFETFLPGAKERNSACCIWRNPMSGKSSDEGAKQSLKFLKHTFE